MEVDCENCGRCCFSPFQPSLINYVKDTKTKEILSSIADLLIKKNIISLEKPFRNGRILRNELNLLINEDLICALAQRVVAYIKDLDFKAVKLSLRHLMVPYNFNGKSVPVLACVFFEPNSKKCQIYNKDFRPLLCKVYPFNEIYKFKLLNEKNKFIYKLNIHPICKIRKIKGELTQEQLKQIDIYYLNRYPINVIIYGSKGCDMHIYIIIDQKKMKRES